jgi:hypothetical protein
MSAVTNDHTTIVQALLDAKADASLQDTNGNTALMHAEHCKHTATAQLLRQHATPQTAEAEARAAPSLVHAAAAADAMAAELLGEEVAMKEAAEKAAAANKGKGKKSPHVCFRCGKASVKCRSCGQCHRAWYCGRDCQRADWPRHKSACRAAVAAEARQATRAREATAAARAASSGGRPVNETCVICIGPVRVPVELPCGHAYCGACLTELRSKGVAQTCPLCRIELPPGVDGLWDLAWRSIKRLQVMVDRGEVAWATLPPAEQEEVDEAMAMLTEAAAQGHANAAYNRGVLLKDVRKDVDGAEAAYRAAIAADPGLAYAHTALGILLKKKLEDVDGAVVA